MIEEKEMVTLSLLKYDRLKEAEKQLAEIPKDFVSVLRGMYFFNGHMERMAVIHMDKDQFNESQEEQIKMLIQKLEDAEKKIAELSVKKGLLTWPSY